MSNPNNFKKILVTGGGGYVGSVLVPRLLDEGYNVRVLDLFLYGENVLDSVKTNPGLEQVKGDIRDEGLLAESLDGCDAVIHLACISNDPSVELNPELSSSINYDAFVSLVRLCKESGVRRFVFASSGSVYGVTHDPDVREDHDLVPVSLYNKYKAKCEEVLLAEQSSDFSWVAVRPATIYGCSPRQRLDLTVNILTNHAVNTEKITVFGGKQMRPNLHIQDMVDLYVLLLAESEDKIAGEIFNVAYDNYSVMDTAQIVKTVVGKEMPEKNGVKIIVTDSDDIRSYHLSSEKLRTVLGFVPERDIMTGVRDLIAAFKAGKLPDSLDDIRYYNIKMMKSINLT